MIPAAVLSITRNLRLYRYAAALSIKQQLHNNSQTKMLVPNQPSTGGIWGLNFQSSKAFATIATDNDYIKINNDKDVKSYNRRWLRENCQCDECQNHDTDQRNVLFYQLQPDQIQVNKTSLDGSNKVSILWGDGHKSTFDLTWLSDNSYPGKVSAITPYLWNGETMQDSSLDLVPYDDLMSSEKGLKRLLNNLLCYGVGIVTGASATLDGTQEVIERVCITQKTLYGDMWRFTSDQARSDTAYTNIPIGPHTDTTYLSMPAGIIVFHCVSHDGEGGKTLLVDGFNAANKLKQENPEAFDTLCKYRIHHKNKDGVHHVESLDPVIKTHPVSGELEMIRYNHYDRSVISTIPQNEMASYLNALEAFSKIMTAQENEFWLKLNPGNVLFVNNWRVLHGRSTFTGRREMCGAYLPRDDWIGKARVLGLIH